MAQYEKSFFAISIAEQHPHQTHLAGQHKHLTQHKHHHKQSLIITATAISTGLLLLLLVAFFFFIKLFRLLKLNKNRKTCISPSLALDQARDRSVLSFTYNDEQASPARSNLRRLQRFSYRELKRATNSFHESQRLGKGGYGVVYRGLLPNGKEVAVKKLVLSSAQGEREFQNELSICTRLDCKYIVKLLGFSSHGEKVRLLVYECMKNRSLQEALLEKTLSTNATGSSSSVLLLDWQRRFNIILDIARALAYLHLDCNPPVIHGDVKPSNVLLDGELCGYLADFGLARVKIISNNDQIPMEAQTSDLQYSSHKLRSDPSEDADGLASGSFMQASVKTSNVYSGAETTTEKPKQTKVVGDRATAMANVYNSAHDLAGIAGDVLSVPRSYLDSPNIRGADSGNILSGSRDLRTTESPYSAEKTSMTSPCSAEEVLISPYSAGESVMVSPYSAERPSIAFPCSETKAIALTASGNAYIAPMSEKEAITSAPLDERAIASAAEKVARVSTNLSSLITPLDSPNNLQELSPASLSPRTDPHLHHSHQLTGSAGLLPSLPPRRSRTISPQKGSVMSSGRDWWWKQEEHGDEVKVKDYVMEWMRSELSASESKRSRDTLMQESIADMEQEQEQEKKQKQKRTIAMAIVEKEKRRIKKRKEIKHGERKSNSRRVMKSAMAVGVQDLSEGDEEEEEDESAARGIRSEQRARDGNGGGSRGGSRQHGGRKSREWWKDEYFAELSRKQKQRQKREEEELHGCAEARARGRPCPILSTVADRFVSRLREAGGDRRPRERENIPRRAGDHSSRAGDCSTTETAASDDLSSTTTTTSMRGTVCYVAPEFGGNGALSEASDIYSFGVLLLVIISGRRPIELTPPSPSPSSLPISALGPGALTPTHPSGGGGPSSPTSLMRRFERANLISWARNLAHSGNVLDLVDDRLHGAFPRDQAQLCIALALSCIRRLPSSRPSISAVLKVLLGQSPPPPTVPVEFSPSPPSRLSFHHSPSPCHRAASLVSSIEDMV